MALKIFWTQWALNNVNKILLYLEQEFGKIPTKRFAVKVYSFTDKLSNFPELGSIQNSESDIRDLL